MARRIVIEEPCEHGTMISHLIDGTEHRVFNAGGWFDEVKDECPGGTRRVLDPDEYVLIEDVRGLPPEAWGVLNAAAAFGHPDGPEALWKDLCAALRADPLPTMADGEQP